MRERIKRGQKKLWQKKKKEFIKNKNITKRKRHVMKWDVVNYMQQITWFRVT